MAKLPRIPQQRPVRSTKVVRVPGQPAPGPLKQQFALKLPLLPIYAKRNIRTLQKVDPAKGITQPEANDMTTAAGVVTGTPGGYRGVRTIHQMPLVPPTPDRNLRVTKPPRPGQGTLKVFGVNRKIRNTNVRKK